MTLKIGELFAGYGGLGMGVGQVLDVDLAWYADVCKFDKDGNAGHYEPHRGPCSIMTHRFPDVPNLGDVSAVDWSQVEPVDVLTGGSPCQDLSHAGRRAGMTEGTRSNLWVAMREAIAQLRPAVVVWENVRGAYSAGADSELESNPRLLDGVLRRDGDPLLRALGRVLGDLSDLGYDARWHGLRAADVGAPHGRFRVFVVAHLADADLEGFGSLGRLDSERRDADGRRGQDGPRPAGEPATPGEGDGLADGEVVGPGGLCARCGLSPRGFRAVPVCDDCVRRVSSAEADRWRETLDILGSDSLLPTPRATDGTKGGPNQRGTSGDLMLPSAVASLLPTPTTRDHKDHTIRREPHRPDDVDTLARALTDVPCALLPTPAVNDMGAGKTVEDWDAWTERMKAEHGNGNGHGKSLSIEAQRLLPTPEKSDGNGGRKSTELGGFRESGAKRAITLATAVDHAEWGDYAAAIARWEHVLGRPAPAPTQTSAKGNPQLSAAFVEWMMGLPAGWVTDVPSITRNEALKALGNGVVPQQAAAALRVMLAWSEVAA